MRVARPAGFLYRPDVLTTVEEAALVARVQAFDFAAVEMRGRVARRRTAQFGWVYGYTSWRIEPGPAIPEALLFLRDRAAALAGVESDALAEVLVTEYQPGAGIGWHRDASQFGTVVGFSLLGACRLRLRRAAATDRLACAVPLEPRSVYVFRDEARWHWQHSIPPTRALRYSITFRTLGIAPGRRDPARQPAPG